ncbi:(Fe-S)-binding protein, partial [Candidatus Bathyarchaeota archaeon]|nr:(Fe-S)-binding protein [Candidatus Bathyarchaeota archaeon]
TVAYGVTYTAVSIFGFELLPYTLVNLAIPTKERVYVVGIHIFVVYVWFLASIVFSGGILKAISCIGVVVLRTLFRPTISRPGVKATEPFGNLTRYGVMQLLACGRDGDCTEACPVHDETNALTSSPRARLIAYRGKVNRQRGVLSMLVKRKIRREDMKEIQGVLYECTLCGRCMSVCPVELDLVSLWKAARESLFLSGLAPAEVKGLHESITVEKNLYGLPNDSRNDWIEYESAVVPRKEKAETVYFVGCVTSFSGRLGGVAKATAAILNHLKEDWSLMKQEEWCCGAPLEFSGATPGLREIAEHNVQAVKSMGARKVIFNCPGCYRMFKERYPQILGYRLGFQPIHIVEYLHSMLRDPRLQPEEKLTGSAAYHDPCELGRLGGMYDEPRTVIRQYVERLAEIPENRGAGRCCGTGGVMKAILPEVAGKVGATRIRQVKSSGAELVLSACPACLIGLDEAAKTEKLQARVADITQLVAEELGLM